MLVVLASAASAAALLVGYVEHAAVDSDQFANRATVALRDPSVRSLIAGRVTDELVLSHAGNLLAARPLIESVVSSVVGGGAFTGAFRAAVRDVHRAVFARDENTLTLTLGDVRTIVAAGLEVVRPSLARQVESDRRVDVLRRHVGRFGGSAIRIADTVSLLAAILAAVALAAAAAAVALSVERRRTIVHLGGGAAVGGVVLVVALAIGRQIAVDHVAGADARAAASAVWDAFLGDLRTAAWILAGSGAVIAAAAASLIRPVDLDAPLRRAWHAVAVEPARPRWRAVRGVALIAVGVLFLGDRDAVVQLVISAIGLYLVYTGVAALLWLVYQPRAARRAPRETPRAGWLRPAVAAAVAIVVIAGAVLAFVGSGGVTTAAPAAVACEGHVQLCDRTLPQVALVATHNAMSVPLPGWFAAEQDRPIADQLRDGVRGLLIDTHYADRLADGKLRTVIGDESKVRRLAKQDGVSPQAVDAALRIRDRLGFNGHGERGMYLCHTLCEIGGTPLGSVLRDLHDFLVANPGAVVVVINQDYVTPQDFVGAVRDADLEKFVYRGPTSGRWLTLRQMVASNQRVLFLAENRAGAAPWYHPAYKAITEETPYTFTRTAQLTDEKNRAASCRANRGPANAPLFLVNHWISTDPVPLPSHAATVNAYQPLLARLRECQRIRRHFPNLVAVNFYRRGDAFRVVDTLNGVR